MAEIDRRLLVVLGLILALLPAAPAVASEVIICQLDALAIAAHRSDGYWVLREGGDPEAYGSARSFGGPSETGYEISARPVALEPTPSFGGYWTATGDGGVFTHGDAGFYGSATSIPLFAPVIDFASTADGTGYWLLASDGGVFTFGAAAFVGSAAGTGTVPFVAIEPTPSGGGYWIARADGAIFPFGDANTFLGPASTIRGLHAPIVDMKVTAEGDGIWLAAGDGGVFTFGSAPFHGSAADVPHNEPMVKLAVTSDDGGYWILSEDGGVFTYGNARFFGATVNPPEDARCDG